jgi:hypothetical protein
MRMAGGIPKHSSNVCSSPIFFPTETGNEAMNNLINVIQMFGAARRAADAARNHRAPSAEDLAILGIPASAFDRG